MANGQHKTDLFSSYWYSSFSSKLSRQRKDEEFPEKRLKADDDDE